MTGREFSVNMMLRLFIGATPKSLTHRGAEILQSLSDYTTGEDTSTFLLFHDRGYVPSPWWDVTYIGVGLLDVDMEVVEALLIQYLANAEI